MVSSGRGMGSGENFAIIESRVADYGLVADLFKAVPELTEELEKAS